MRSRTKPRGLTGAAAIFAIAALAAAAQASSRPAQASLEQVGNQVYCQCGCVTVLNHCPHLPSECQSRAQMTGTILAGVKRGKSDSAILADLVNQFGVHVLASPPSNGFNITVWILPGIALVIGLGLVIVLVRRWRARTPAQDEPAPETPVDSRIMAAVEEEMERVAGPKD